MATQIFTGSDNITRSRPIYPSEYMPGALKITLSDRPSVTDFLGFGVALTGSSCYLLNQMKADERGRFLRAVYSPDGLDLSVARISVGASDYSAEIYTYEDSRGNFSVERDEAYVIPMIKEVLKIKPDLYIYASPWSPPGWMKTGGSIAGGFMRAEFVEDYADYIIKFLLAYEEHGIHISALTPQNEPETHHMGRMPACMWHPDIEAAYVKALRRKLDQRGMDVRIWLHDHNFKYIDRVMWELDNTPGLSEALDGVGFHYYSGHVEQALAIAEKYPHLKLHFTEGGPRLYDHYEEDRCKWGIISCRALSCGFSSFVGWNLMLDELGGPNVGPFFCGGLATRHSITGELTYSGQYSAFKHISPYIKPDSKVYTLSADEGDSMFEYPNEHIRHISGVMVENSNGSRVFVLVNGSSQKKQTQLFINNSWWYVELMPETVSTLIFE